MRDLFASRCSDCHTIGKGDGVGPDLAGVLLRRDRAWLTRYVAEPDKMLAERDPLAVELLARYRDVRMPNLGLEPGGVSLLLSHVEEMSTSAHAQAPPGRPDKVEAASVP